MSKLLQMVGYDGITNGHTYAVNDMSYVANELLPAVAYDATTTEKITEYFTKIRANTLEIFNSEVMNYLSCNAKFSDTLLRFPEGDLDATGAALAVLAGQNIQQTYDLSKVMQFGRLKLGGLLLYMKGTYNMRISIRYDYKGLLQGENLFQETYVNDTSAADHVTIREIDLSEVAGLKNPINSKRQNQLVVFIEALGDSTFLPQTFHIIPPEVDSITQEFDITGGFSQGFSAGFASGIGELLGSRNPVCSLVQSSVAFDIREYISQNAERLALAFALRVGCRILSDKLTGQRLNIFTNSDRENTKEQVAELELKIKQHLKMVASSLLFNVQSTQTPPIVLEGSTGYEMGSYLGFPDEYQNTGYGDLGAYPGSLRL